MKGLSTIATCSCMTKTNNPEFHSTDCLFFRNTFINMFIMIAEDINQTAKDKGWWDEERNEGEIIALIHSELSEALEALRHGNPPDDKIPKFKGVESELADVIIRIMDYALSKEHLVPHALFAKIDFNKTRPKMHGGKKF